MERMSRTSSLDEHRLSDGTATDPHLAGSPASRAGATLHDGEPLAGRYRITRFIAGGGMGEVYEARDGLLDERVAVKLLRRELIGKPGAVERFTEEIRLARRITHPNVCRVFDVGVDGDRVFFTMELHEGDTLAGLIARRGPLAESEARPIARQLLAAVAAAHAADVVHADLKPSNILLAGRDGARVIITDFGLAISCCAEMGCPCDMPHLRGTPAYAAPELIAGSTARDRTDVFAIGVILYELMTGALPWRGDTPLATARARLDHDAPPPRSLRPDLDPRWDAGIRGCLARDPEARTQSVADLGRALGLAD